MLAHTRPQEKRTMTGIITSKMGFKSLSCISIYPWHFTDKRFLHEASNKQCFLEMMLAAPMQHEKGRG